MSPENQAEFLAQIESWQTLMTVSLVFQAAFFLIAAIAIGWILFGKGESEE